VIGSENNVGAKQTVAKSSVSSSEEKQSSKEELESYAKAKSELERRAEPYS